MHKEKVTLNLLTSRQKELEIKDQMLQVSVQDGKRAPSPHEYYVSLDCREGEARTYSQS